jgi:hypothetical protein
MWRRGRGNGRLIRGSVPVILLERQRKTKAALRQNNRYLDRNSTLAPPEISSEASLFDAACLAGTLFSYEIRMCTSNMASLLGVCLYLIQK